MVSIKKIASDIGVTAATVSNALNGKGRVSEVLASRIRARADELGYRPSSAAIALKSGRSHVLGLVMPDLTNPLFPHIAQALSIAADRLGFAILIADSRGSVEEQDLAISRLISRGVDGLLVVPQRGSSPASPTTPMTIINTASDPNNSVSADHWGGGAQMARHITALGHKKILIIGADAVSEVQQDRIAGMKSQLPYETKVEILWGTAGIEQAADHVSKGVSAILTTSDLLAINVHSHLTRAGFTVPDDVSLTGFDDMAFSAAMHPPLTTIAQDVDTLADYVLDIITAQIEGKASPHVGQTIAMDLVLRHSTTAPRSPSNKEPHP
ncbi:LacI family DNA-binding transcriptional regulator [Cohaesibacter celericrescens]|uniref:LacI family transcriptional regulator n=1 Tax=Cohaesibacter celericrescens TaxID=2067669 RepID=A0A2N5XNA8_9HYPH|nr:LacI family DNA-binding transcriptional regulator [Cohaesibacter celericrescens]PLW75908.1 LacI family transcriptional regulator [Cohaesibacter celericrescens]